MVVAVKNSDREKLPDYFNSVRVFGLDLFCCRFIDFAIAIIRMFRCYVWILVTL